MSRWADWWAARSRWQVAFVVAFLVTFLAADVVLVILR